LDKTDFNVKMVAMNLNGEVGVASITREDNTPPAASIMTDKGYKLITGKSFKSE
jgi:hypothetical protein